MRRVHIVGGMGTGKTWLSLRLGQVLGVPVHELDLSVDLDAVSKEPGWVTEGIFLWGIEPLLSRADAVVWLDLPYRVAVRRIVIRHFRLSLRGQNRHRGLRLLWRFAVGSRSYWTTSPGRGPEATDDWGALSRAQTITTLAAHRPKVVQLRTPREVLSWLEGLRLAPIPQKPRRTGRRA